jgi:Trk K+ transport system NAD-binding subunit
MLRRSRRVAWILPLIPAMVVTAYLDWGAWVSARDPAWLYWDQQWWRIWLRPGSDGPLVVVVVLWLAAAALYWWPRRRRPQEVGLIIVAAMVVLGAVLAAASLAPCRGGQSRTAMVAWIMSLYVGALEPRYGPGTTCPGQLPLALQLGRGVCLGATLVGALSVAAVLWRQPVSRLRASLVKDATILTGLDAMTLPLLRRLTAGGHENRVVVIEPDQRHPLLDEARGTGAQIVIADPASARVLAPMLKGLRGPQLRYLYSLRPDTAQNEAVLTVARGILGRSRVDPDKPPHLVARIDDPRHADVWRGRHVGSSPLWFEDALSPQETTASALVSQIIRISPRRVLLCGDSTLALAVLLELARCVWEWQGLAESAAKGKIADATAAAQDEAVRSAMSPRPAQRVVILDHRAEDLRREFRATSPEPIVAALPDVEVRAEGWHDGLLAFLDAMAEDEAAQTAVVIAGTAVPADLHEAGRVARLHPGTPVFVLSSEGAGITGTAFDKLQPFERALLVDGKPPDDAWTRIARHWHESYRLLHPADPGAGNEPTRRPWGELDEFIRQDNILQLRSVMAAVVARGRHWVPSRAVIPGSFVELTPGEIERVARQEHDRWYERRRKAGWRAARSGEEDDYALHVNRNVRPWPELPPRTRETIQANIRSQFAGLEAVGFMPVLPGAGSPGARDFRRMGEVRVERLTADRSWTHSPGGQLTGARGDWKVIDDSGHERTVRDQEFRATHKRLDDDRWRRTGTVRAWRVSEVTVLRTIEGKAMARPGDWIVQGPRGERWPVTDQQFMRGYRPA